MVIVALSMVSIDHGGIERIDTYHFFQKFEAFCINASVFLEPSTGTACTLCAAKQQNTNPHIFKIHFSEEQL